MSSNIYRKLGFYSAVAVGTVAIYIASVSLFQSKLIYMPRSYAEQQNYYNKYFNRKDIKQLQYNDKQEGKHTAYYTIINPNSRHSNNSFERVFIMLGGNAALALDFVYTVDAYQQYLTQLGILDYVSPTSFLLIDYPGYNTNSGNPSPAAILEATQAALKTLIEKEKFENKTIKLGLIGHSLGSACCLQLADILTRNGSACNIGSATILIDKIILLSPFTSILEVANALIGRIPLLRYLLNHNFDNVFHLAHFIQNLEQIQANRTDPQPPVKLLIMHGDQDRIVPVEMGRELALIASNPDHSAVIECNYEELIGVDHNDIFNENTAQRMFQTMAEKELPQ